MEGRGSCNELFICNTLQEGCAVINCRAGQEMIALSHKIFEIKKVLLFHTRIKPKALYKILEREREQGPPKKPPCQSYALKS